MHSNQPTSDREVWSTLATDFGTTRFQNPENDPLTQAHRINTLRSAIRADRIDAASTSDIHLFDTLQAKAKMNYNKATDPNGIAPEMFKSLPFEATINIHNYFKELYNTARLPPTTKTGRTRSRSAYPKPELPTPWTNSDGSHNSA